MSQNDEEQIISSLAQSLNKNGIIKLFFNALSLTSQFNYTGVAYELVEVLSSLYKSHVIKRYSKFLKPLEDINEKDVEAFQRKFEQDKAFSEKIIDNLILQLENLDDIEKFEILGKIYKAFIVSKIDYSWLRALYKAVLTASVDDLNELIDNKLIDSKDNIKNKLLGKLLGKLTSSGLSQIKSNVSIFEQSKSKKDITYHSPPPPTKVDRPPVTFPQTSSEKMREEKARIEYELTDLGILFTKIM